MNKKLNPIHLSSKPCFQYSGQKGFSEDDINLLISVNPSKAYGIQKRRIKSYGEKP